LSMAPSALGPVKAMILSLDSERAARHVEALLKSGASGSARNSLIDFARDTSIEL
jgi:phosphotransferase system, enzyme I, PtsP